MRLLLSGYYGFGNLGDEAILAGLAPALQARGHEVTVLSRAPEATVAAHGVRARHRLSGIPAGLLHCDALISGGGGLLQNKTSRRSLGYYLGLISLAKRLGKRVLVYGQSVGPLSDEGKRRVARALERVPVAVRDEASLELLHSLGISAALTADAALLLPPPASTTRTEAVLLIPRGGYPAITTALTDLARHLTDRGQPVALGLVQPGEDQAEVDAIRTAVPSVQLWSAETPTALLAACARARYVVSGRLHGLILAARARTDFAGLVYDPKVRAFAREAGAPALELPLAPGALLKVALSRPSIPAERVRELESRAEAGLDWLETQLSNP